MNKPRFLCDEHLHLEVMRQLRRKGVSIVHCAAVGGQEVNPLTLTNYIERKPNSEKYQIVGKGITVEFLSYFINDPEWPVERICAGYHLTPAEVYSAWAFYYDHQAEMGERKARIEAEDTNRPDAAQALKAEFKARYKARTGHDYDDDTP